MLGYRPRVQSVACGLHLTPRATDQHSELPPAAIGRREVASQATPAVRNCATGSGITTTSATSQWDRLDVIGIRDVTTQTEMPAGPTLSPPPKEKHNRPQDCLKQGKCHKALNHKGIPLARMQ